MIREPAVAGQFYPDSPEKLRSMIKGMVDDKAEKVDAVGAILPHAGYVYSGAVTGATLSRIKFKDAFIIMGPNHTGVGKNFSIMTEGVWKTPLGDVAIDADLAKQLLSASKYLEEDASAQVYEHSIEVQLPFLQYFKNDIKIVPIVFSYAEGTVYEAIGKELAQAIRQSGRGIVMIASSDMTHYETQQSAKKKDSAAIDAILHLDGAELLKRVEEMGISMCGYAPALSLIAAARELGSNGVELVKYQTSGDVTRDYDRVVGYAGIIIKGISPIAALARRAVETYVTTRKRIQPGALTSEMQERAGVFVSIHKGDNLRGCIGTYVPSKPNVAEEIISNAINSATRDPRFPPVIPDELPDLNYSVDVLSRPEPVDSKEQLDPKKYGAIVECGLRRGLLLPDLEGVDTVDYQVDICCQKAGIAPGEPVKLYRFEVQRYQ
jgi:MEMO1 family protein